MYEVFELLIYGNINGKGPSSSGIKYNMYAYKFDFINVAISNDKIFALLNTTFSNSTCIHVLNWFSGSCR